MTNIYLVRHCECTANIDRRLSGRIDYPITEKGKGQLDGLAEKFRHIALDAVYASPLIRTRQTAQAIARYNGAPVSIDARFIEFDFGEIDGIQMKDQTEEIKRPWLDTPHQFSAPGGDDMASFGRRVWEALLALVSENQGKTIAVATHGNVIRCLSRNLQRLPEEALKEVEWSGNTAVHQICFIDTKNWEYLLKNDTTHLPEEVRGPLERPWK